MSSEITQSIIEQFQQDGAICLRGVFDERWIRKVANGIEKNKQNPSDFGENLKAEGSSGYYFNDYFNCDKISEFRQYVMESPAAEIAGKLMQSEVAVFYHEHVLTKDPGTYKVTPWHQDQPYYPIDGTKNCSIWMPVDEVPLETTIQFVKGSHKWGKWFHPRKFATENNYNVVNSNQSRAYENVPNIEAFKEDYEILEWAVKPGDCVVFHMLTLHGAPSNTSLTTPRRILSTRWLGDDAVFATRPWVTSPPITGGLNPGDRVRGGLFPVVWRRKE